MWIYINVKRSNTPCSKQTTSQQNSNACKRLLTRWLMIQMTVEPHCVTWHAGVITMHIVRIPQGDSPKYNRQAKKWHSHHPQSTTDFFWERVAEATYRGILEIALHIILWNTIETIGASLVTIWFMYCHRLPAGFQALIQIVLCFCGVGLLLWQSVHIDNEEDQCHDLSLHLVLKHTESLLLLHGLPNMACSSCIPHY